MRKCNLTYSANFRETPMTYDILPNVYVPEPVYSTGGKITQKTRLKRNPYFKSRVKWCLLEVHYDGVDLIFQSPAELDRFFSVLSKRVMPSGISLNTHEVCTLLGEPDERVIDVSYSDWSRTWPSPWTKPGRPRGHWLSRLPGWLKKWKVRQDLLMYLGPQNREIRVFRKFYETGWSADHADYPDLVSLKPLVRKLSTNLQRAK